MAITRKRYSKTEDLFILDEIAKSKTIREGTEKLAVALARTPIAIENRYRKLKDIYPEHLAFSLVRTRKEVSEEATKSRFKKFIDKIFHRHGSKVS